MALHPKMAERAAHTRAVHAELKAKPEFQRLSAKEKIAAVGREVSKRVSSSPKK